MSRELNFLIYDEESTCPYFNPLTNDSLCSFEFEDGAFLLVIMNDFYFDRACEFSLYRSFEIVLIFTVFPPYRMLPALLFIDFTSIVLYFIEMDSFFSFCDTFGFKIYGLAVYSYF